MLHEDERIGGRSVASMLVCWNRCTWYFFIECTVLVWGCQGKLCWNSFAITGNSKCKLEIYFGA